MARTRRPVIAINIGTGQRKRYDSVLDASRALGVSHQPVLVALAMNSCIKGWRLYDSPENIVLRIRDLEEQLRRVEG